MTETELQPAAPKPRAKPPVRRPVARPANGGTIDQFADIQRQLDELKAGRVPYVESEPPYQAKARVADTEELTEFQRELMARTHETPRGFQRETVSYNFPERWFAKPDGSIVKLQGDPQNRGYYRDKGFNELTPDQVQRWLSVERPKLLKLQQEKASLINTIRRAVQVDPALAAGLDPSWEIDLDRMNLVELRGQLEEIAGMPTTGGQKRRLMKRLPRLQDADDAAAEAEGKRLLQGVETVPTRTALDAFEQAMAQQQPRRSHDIEVTPHNAAQFR